jgi:hypothetical protein
MFHHGRTFRPLNRDTQLSGCWLWHETNAQRSHFGYDTVIPSEDLDE